MNQTTLKPILIKLLLLTVSLVTAPVQARMYQWISSESGTTQLSGKPPAWYRGTDGGPRVYVFDKGELIDDTGVKVDDTRRVELRGQAFHPQSEQQIGADKLDERALLAAKLLELLDLEYEEEELSEELETTPPAPSELEQPELSPRTPRTPRPSATAIEQLKDIIAEWEQRRTEQAKRVLSGESEQQGQKTPAPDDQTKERAWNN